MEKIILKAIEEGYKNIYIDIPNGILETNRVVLDPLFWQALGKAEGWNREIGENCCNVCGEPMTVADGQMFRYHGYVRDCPTPPLRIKEWKKEWHKFIDHLANGGEIEKFFEDLLAK